MVNRLLLGAILGGGLLAAQTLKDCRTVFLQPMPEALDQFISVELLKWGGMAVVTAAERADCVALFRRALRTAVTSSGSTVVPREASVETDVGTSELPRMTSPFLNDRRTAALMLVHRPSQTIVWADAKADGVFSHGGAKPLARKLVDQLRRDLTGKAARK